MGWGGPCCPAARVYACMEAGPSRSLRNRSGLWMFISSRRRHAAADSGVAGSGGEPGLGGTAAVSGSWLACQRYHQGGAWEMCLDQPRCDLAIFATSALQLPSRTYACMHMWHQQATSIECSHAHK